MACTEATHKEYTRHTDPYESDLTDEEWRRIEPSLPAPSSRGRPRRVDLRAVVDALMYQLMTSCQWRALPRCFPAVSTALAGMARVPALEIVKKRKGQQGFEVLPRRWVVERFFGWPGRCRRLVKDYERSLESSLAWLQLALIRIMVRRLGRAENCGEATCY